MDQKVVGDSQNKNIPLYSDCFDVYNNYNFDLDKCTIITASEGVARLPDGVEGPNLPTMRKILPSQIATLYAQMNE